MRSTPLAWSISAVLLTTAAFTPSARAATLPDVTTAKAAIKCQHAILQNGSKFVTGKLANLQKCTGAILTCIEVKGGSPTCLAVAAKKCTGNLARILTGEVVFARSIEKACDKVSSLDLAADVGLAYERNAEQCLRDFGADVSTREGVVTCIVRQHARTAEELFAVQQARTVKLLEVAGVSRTTLCDVPTNPDCEGCAISNPPDSGKKIAACAAVVAKAGTAFVKTAITALTKCTKATFACATTPATPEKTDACTAKSVETCNNAFASLTAARNDTDVKIETSKSCGGIPFAVLVDTGALNLGALASDCTTAVGGSLPTLAAYAQCLHQRHECDIKALAPFAAPRIDELLGGVGISDPLCPPTPQAQSGPLIIERIGGPLLAAAATATLGEVGDIILAINSPGGAPTDHDVGGFKQPTTGATNSVDGVSGTVTFRTAQAKPIKIAYSKCGVDKVSPNLIVSVKNPGDELIPGFFKLALPAPADDAAEAEIDVTFQPTVRSCVRLAFATECGDSVSPYVRLQQVPDIDPKESATPTPTPSPTPGTPTTSPTPTVATPTAAGTPSAATLACGDVISGTLSPVGNVDLFSFSGQAGDKVALTMISTTGGTTPKATVFSPSHAQLGGIVSSNGTVEFTLAETGTHTVRVVESPLTSTGGYNIALACRMPLGPVDAVLTCGDVFSGTLTPAGDTDFFTFSGQAGDQISLTMISTTGATTPNATVFSPSGAQLGGVVNSNGTVDVTLAETGTHTVQIVESPVTATGGYNVALACRVPVAPIDATLHCGDVLSGSLTPAGDSDFFVFDGQAGDKVALTMISTSGGTTPKATVFSPSHAQLGGIVSSNGTVEFTLAETGTHTVRVVESPLTSTGGYNIALACRMPLGPVDAVLTCGDVFSGTLTPAGDTDFFTFSGQAGDQISLTMISTTGATTPNATMFSPSGAQLGGVVNSNGTLDVTLAETGTHTVRIVESPLTTASGGYNVALACRVPVVPIDATLHCGDVLSGSLTPAGDSDFFVFDGQAGDKVALTMISTTGGTTPKATVFSPSHAQLGGIVSSNGTVEFTLAETGTHTVQVVESPLTSTGGYNIALACRMPLGPVDAVLTCGDVFSGTLTPAGDTDFFTFSGQAGDQISLTMISTTGATTPNATVFSPSGAQLGGVVNSNGTVDLTLAETGTHTVRIVESPLTATGGYNVALACRVPVAPIDATLHCGDVLSGSLTPAGDSDFFVFDGQAGDHVSLTMTSTTGGTTPTATVFSPGGAQLGGNVNANATVGFVLEVTGTHSVRVVQSPLTSTGDYKVGLSCP